MTRRANIPPQLGPEFGYSEAIDAGVSAGRLRAKDLSAPYRGTRSRRAVISTAERAGVYAVRLLPGQRFSHLTAAELLGLRLPEGFVPGPLHVTSTPPTRAPRCEDVVGHQSKLGRSIPFAGLPVTDPVTTWLDCARYLGVDDLIVMGDGLVNRKSPVTTVEGLVSAVKGRRATRGYTRLVLALHEIRPNTDSARETLLRLMLCRAGFPEPEPNGEIRDANGEVVAHGDLLYRSFMVLVEYDGWQHRGDEAQFDIDIERLDRIRALGWTVIRVGKSLMRKPEAVFAKVDEALAKAETRPPPNLP